jgi:hypothetical protein
MSWFRNRFVITFGGTAILVLLWNVYVSFNDDGILTGQVVDADGTPVEDATVTINEKALLVSRSRGSTTTDADGRFTFIGHHLYRIFLEAEKDGVGRATPVEVRLYFKGENSSLTQPIQLAPPAP